MDPRNRKIYYPICKDHPAEQEINIFCNNCNNRICPMCWIQCDKKNHRTIGTLDMYINKRLQRESEERRHTTDVQGADSSPQVKMLIVEPRFKTLIKTEYDELLFSVSCLDEYVWVCGDSKEIKLYNVNNRKGKPEMWIETITGNRPGDIAVTKKGDLVYTDCIDCTVNIVRNTKTKEVETIRLQGWKPRNVCSTSSGDLLVVMDSDNEKQTKVVRYSGSTGNEERSYQFKGNQPFFKYGGFKYIIENGNKDICVADHAAGAVVVIDQLGHHRFTYPDPNSDSKISVKPIGIATDSHMRILTVDGLKQCILVLNQDGVLLRSYSNHPLQGPWGLCVDTRDNLLVVQSRSLEVKRMKYC